MTNTIEIQVRTPCPTCDGTGFMDIPKVIYLPSGYGEQGAFQKTKQKGVCTTCKGEGKATKWMPLDEALTLLHKQL